MKKRFLIASAVLGMASLSVFTSCKKDENKPMINSGEATIKGIVKAPVDYTKYSFDMNSDSTSVNDFHDYDKDLEFAPAGTKIIVHYDESELMTSSAISNTKTIETEVGTNGEYSVTIPTGANPISVTIEVPDLIVEAKIPNLQRSGSKFIALNKDGFFQVKEAKTKRSVLKADDEYSADNIVKGTTRVVDIEYYSENLNIISEINTASKITN